MIPFQHHTVYQTIQERIHIGKDVYFVHKWLRFHKVVIHTNQQSYRSVFRYNHKDSDKYNTWCDRGKWLRLNRVSYRRD